MVFGHVRLQLIFIPFQVSFRKAKLLTKAYYKLLRESSTPLVDPAVQVRQKKALY